MDWETKEVKEIKTKIPIFLNSTVMNTCFDRDRIVLEIIHKTKTTILIITEENSQILESPVKNKEKSISLLDYIDNQILISVHCPTQSFKIFYGKFEDQNIQWKLIEKDEETKKMVKGKVKWSVSKTDQSGIEYISIFPEKEGKVPLILNPHGGPHGNNSTIYRSEALCFALHGYNMISVNYRGSIGYSRDFVECLLGHIGDYDVKDCFEVVMDTIKKGIIDENKLYYLGGSHGGFLGGHIVGQYPNHFKACILHNPVINLASMIFTTDIPDWVWSEIGFDPYLKQKVTNEVFEKAYKSSPIYYIEKVKTPVLLLLGEDDKRVPIEQGKQYYFELKERGVETKIMLYKGQSHPISDPQESCDRVVSSLLWFEKY